MRWSNAAVPPLAAPPPGQASCPGHPLGEIVVFPEWGPERRNFSARVNPGTFEPGCEVEQAVTYSWGQTACIYFFEGKQPRTAAAGWRLA